LHRSKVSSAGFIFSHISGILDNSRFDRAVSKHFLNPQPKEVHHEDFPSHRPILRIPANERETSYVSGKEFQPEARIFPLSYAAARLIVKKAGNLVGARVRPCDLRRHADTRASRSGTPLEIVSKVLRRHSNLSTTQRCLGKISDAEAMRWIDNLQGKIETIVGQGD
jgi:integrase